MSLDIVDDLEAAEGHVAELQVELVLAAETVHYTYASPRHRTLGPRTTYEECTAEECLRRQALCEPRQRPTCEDDQCDEVCGGYHPDGEP